jgi:hypothetical protein
LAANGAFIEKLNVAFCPGATTDSVILAGLLAPSQVLVLNWLDLSCGAEVARLTEYLPLLYQCAFPVFFMTIVTFAVPPAAIVVGMLLLTTLELKLPAATLGLKNWPSSFIQVLPSATRLKYSL